MRSARHSSELERLQALAEYEPESADRDPGLQDLVLFATKVFDTPVSLISVVDTDRQWFRAEIGFGRNETTRDESFCSHAILQDDVFEVQDALTDPRFEDNPLVTGPPHVRFYAGVPIRSSSGLPLGSFCVVDSKPRELSGIQRDTLLHLARQAESRLELLKKAKELTETRAGLEMVLEAAELGVWRWDVERRKVEANSRLQFMFGISNEAASDGSLEHYLKSVSSIDRDRVSRAIGQSVGTGSRYEVEYRVVGGDQVERWILTRGKSILGQDGKTKVLSGIAIDITDRVETHDALRQSEVRRERALESAQIGAWNIELPNQKLTTDPLFRKIFGVETETVEYEDAFKQIHPEDRQMVRDRLAETLVPGSSPIYSAEYRVIHADHSEHWVFAQGRANFGSEGGVEPVSLDGTVLDITTRKLVEKELQESQVKLNDVANNVDQLIWTADADGYITWYNRRWYEYTGTTPEQMEGWGWQVVHDPSVLPDVLNLWRISIDTGVPFEMEFPLRGADGVFRPFLTRVHPIQDDTGKVLRWFGTNTDIESQKEAESTLERRVEERTLDLTRANRDLNEFSYSVAHDLRAPLRAIASTSSILLEEAGSKLSAQESSLLSRQMKNAVRLASLVDDLLAFSRLGKEPVRRNEFDFTLLCHTLIADNAPTTWKSKCRFQVQEGMVAVADAKLLGYAITNLLDNACKFSVDGGSVSVGQVEQAYFVKDNGIGFDMAYAEKIFVAFERLVDQETFQGTGVGLANVKRIVERHGGKIWADSIEGKGSTFWFTLAP